ncbi:sensor domain-containing protein [Segniliparus rugosus]|uniref:PknH-like extracellular domain-containing protein n=1 Tax=Segniliparus rugosus (strain ATCC BAA-974 / DSM 45345 / CCUG 50838 / CIP 108380 / JCM 13579 / CDC 945) TaxID=679197 RepID=E5XRK4_SEGRC|nr:sensor domain-containing protein [Segniliparus rugosus]EFV13022.2 hypothetical protein HMPREF9336_02126 [Segniliparus rugosus ATCC BAA-974]
MTMRWWGVWGAALLTAGLLLAVYLNSGSGGVLVGAAARAGSSSAAKRPACSPDDPSEPAGSLLPGSRQAKQALVTADEVSLIVGCRMHMVARAAREVGDGAASSQPAQCAVLAGLGRPEAFSGASEPPISVRYSSRGRKAGKAEWTVVEHVGLFPDPKSAEAAFDAFLDALESCDLLQEAVEAPVDEDQASSARLAKVSVGPDWAKWSPAGAARRSYPLVVGHKGNVLYQFEVLHRPVPKKGRDPLDALIELSREKIPD